jgi:hypothetical protein
LAIFQIKEVLTCENETYKWDFLYTTFMHIQKL